jgi:hypothetical protein
MLYREQMLLSLDDFGSVRKEYNRVVTEAASDSLAPALRVRLRAITANKVTRNRTFYPLEELEGDGVSKGYITVLKPYPIPIMLDHRTTGNALTSADMPVPVGRAVDARVVRKGRGRREGYLEVDAVIYDRRVIEMVLDGRFMTVSIGQIPERVECSVCGAQVEGYACPNGHERGGTYEWQGELRSCYHIMRGLELIEISFVNVPSDSDAVVLSKALDSGTLTMGGLEMADIDSLKDVVVHESVGEQSDDSVDVVDESVEDVEPRSEGEGEDQEEVSPEELYLIDGELPYPEAKLTAAQRKRLPDSAFCGPNRSFPAHDRPHVLAGLRLLGRAKLSPAQKARVRACLLRKARQMGMKTGQDDDGESAVVFWLVPEHGEGFAEYEWHQLPHNVDQSAKVVMAYGGTVLLEISDDQFAQLESGAPASSTESVYDEAAELRATVAELEVQLREWMDRAQKAEQEAQQARHEMLVMRAVSAALSAGYPPARGKSTAELYEMFRNRSEEFLNTLLQDLGDGDSLQTIVNGLDDVQNPLQGLEAGGAEGMPDEHVQEPEEGRSGQAHRYSAVDELLQALKSGKLSVQEESAGEEDIVRLFYR